MLKMPVLFFTAALWAATASFAAHAYKPALVEFLDAIGVSTDLAAIDAKPDRLMSEPLARPLAKHSGKIDGYRFFPRKSAQGWNRQSN